MDLIMVYQLLNNELDAGRTAVLIHAVGGTYGSGRRQDELDPGSLYIGRKCLVTSPGKTVGSLDPL